MEQVQPETRRTYFIRIARSPDLLAAQRAQEARAPAGPSARNTTTGPACSAAGCRGPPRGTSPSSSVVAGAAVDEDELRPQDEALALHVGAHRHDAAAAERVERFLLALHEARLRVRREQHRAGDDQRVLVLLADLLPVVDVGEDAARSGSRSFSSRICCAWRLRAARLRGGRRRGRLRRGRPAAPWRSRRSSALAPAVARRRVLAALPRPVPAAAARRHRSRAATTSMRSWLRSRRTVSRLASTSSEPPAMKPAIEHALERRDVHLGLDGRLDRHLVEARARPLTP